MANKMHVKKDDIVQVISGKDKGKTGKVCTESISSSEAFFSISVIYFSCNSPFTRRDNGRKPLFSRHRLVLLSSIMWP